MKRKSLTVLVSGLLVIFAMTCIFTGCAPQRATEIEYIPADGARYQNHLEIGGQWANSAWMAEGSTYGIGDPFVMRHNGKYYLYPSTADGRGGVKVYESDNLVNWSYKGFAVDPSEQTAVGAYAPEVVYYNGYFYMCQSRAGQGHYIYRSESPTQGFTLVSKSNAQQGDVNFGNLAMGIDGSFYLSDDGKLYLLHTSTPSGLKFNQITDVGDIRPETITSPRNLGDANLLGWIEGPGIIRRGDVSYLTYTGNHVISSGYRVAYSYAKNLSDLGKFVQPKDNVTLMDTDVNHLGLGHSSNFNGPDLDSIYTAYHSYVGGGPSRRYNLDRYLTNGGVMTANGVTFHPVIAPYRPTAEAQNGESLAESNGKYFLGVTQDYFTAEYNFIPNDDQTLYFSWNSDTGYALSVSNNVVELTRVLQNSAEVVATKQVSFPKDKLATVRVESGDGVGYVYLNGMRVITFEQTLGAGSVGYATKVGVHYTAFTNDVFGTSDFEAIKNFPTKFPATSYLKGEGRGFSILDGKVVQGGLRVGEKQNLVAVAEDDCYAVKLNVDDWVKYGVDIPADDTYSICARVTTASKGAQLKITIGEESFTCQIDENLSSNGQTTKISLGSITLKKGLASMKVQVVKGTAEIVTFETYKNASAPQNANLSDFETVRGNVSVENNAVQVVGMDNHSVALWGNTGICNFQTQIKFTCQLDNSSNLGIMIRAEDYSYYPSQPTQSWRGYYLQIGQHVVSLSRYNYGEEVLGAIRVGDNFQNAGEEHTVTITAHSNRITVVLDDKFTVEVADDCAFLSGQLGVFASSGQITLTGFTYKTI